MQRRSYGMSVPHAHIRRGVSCTLCPPVPWLPVVTTPVLPPPPAVLWRLEVRGREVYCDAARYAHICIPVEPDSGTYVFITTLWPPYGASCFAHYSNTAEKRFIHSVPPPLCSALLPAPSPPPPPQTTPACLPTPAFNPPHLPSHSSCIPYIYATSTAFRVFRVCVAAWLMGVVCQTASCCSKRIANERPTIPAHFAAL